MAKQDINYGTTAGDGTGESLFAAFKKAKENFDDLYGAKTEFVANAAALPATGEATKIYMALDTGVVYRWTGSAYVALTFGVGTDANGNTVLVGGDGEVIPMGGATTITSITYNGDGTVATYVKNGTTYTLSYNASGFVSVITGSDGSTVTPTYDANNNVTALTVA